MNFEGRRGPAALKNAEISRLLRASFSACVLGAFWSDSGSIPGSILVTVDHHFRDRFPDRKKDALCPGWRASRGWVGTRGGAELGNPERPDKAGYLI